MSANEQKDTLPAPMRKGMAGNQRARTHGLYTKSKSALSLRAKRVKRLVNKAVAVCPWLQLSDLPTLRSWGETVILKADLFATLQQVGLTRVDLATSDVAGKRLLHDWARLSSLELSYARELGMTPAARAAMRVDALTGDDLAARASKLRNGDDH